MLAVRSTEPGGECTTPAIYFTPVELPMLEMYSRGLTLHIGRAHVRAVLPEILGYIAGGVLDPAAIGVQRSTWDDVPEAVVQPPTKLLVSRG
jgi:alcohol dehydrogenase